jgi:polyphosphate kinase
MSQTQADHFFNRELSWLAFNQRVLEIGMDPQQPALERAKFLAIFASNLDEFLMVRVATLLRRIDAGDTRPDMSGLIPREQLTAVLARISDLRRRRDQNWMRSLAPKLRRLGIDFLTLGQLSETQRKYIRSYFQENIFPVINPMACDLGHPFPVLQAKQLYFAVHSHLEGGKKKERLFSILPVPSKVLPRLLELPGNDERYQFVFLEDIIRAHLQAFYVGNEITAVGLFRIVRDAEFSLEEADAEDLLQLVENQLKERRKGAVVHLYVEQEMNKALLKRLRKELETESELIMESRIPLDTTFLFELYGRVDIPQAKEKPINGILPGWSEGDIFQALQRCDRFLHHPYHQFEPIITLLRQAAEDPDVLAIKQVLYRVSGNSPVIKALSKAAENGKQVTVLVELTARFDEENNIEYAQQLEAAGCHVVYGVLGFKTHAKALLVIRRESSGIRRYVHLATGNYNDKTAKLYTDCGIMSSREDIAEEVSHLFNVITGYSRPNDWQHLAVAPINMKEEIINLIKAEIAISRPQIPGHIAAKMNSLLDPDVIEALYEASANDVHIDLYIRGICALRPGVSGLSENIRVKSIVGRYLEHPRLFRFNNGNEPRYYLASADWMPRNLEKRVEAMVPIIDEQAKAQIDEIFAFNAADNRNSWLLSPDGDYNKVKHAGIEAFDVFTRLHEAYARRQK